jgi:hypothetical protein
MCFRRVLDHQVSNTRAAASTTKLRKCLKIAWIFNIEDMEKKEVIEQFEPGVYVTVLLLPNGTKSFQASEIQVLE